MKKSLSDKLSVSILIGSFIIAIAILFNSLTELFPGKSIPPNDPQKIYENINYIKTTDAPFLGSSNASVTVIEYIDFECPICKKAYDEIIPKLKNEYINTNKVKFLYKSQPIDSLHKTAFLKARAAYCSYALGGNNTFFKYHDLLFMQFISNTNTISSQLISLASQVNLDPLTFAKCLESAQSKTAVQKDITESIAINSGGTPTWLIGKTNSDGLTNTVKITGLHPFYVYQTIIDNLLEN